MRKAPVLVAGLVGAAYFLGSADKGTLSRARSLLGFGEKTLPGYIQNNGSYTDGGRGEDSSSGFDRRRKRPYFTVKVGDMKEEFELRRGGEPREIPPTEINTSEVVPDYSTKERAVLSQVMKPSSERDGVPDAGKGLDYLGVEAGKADPRFDVAECHFTFGRRTIRGVDLFEIKLEQFGRLRSDKSGVLGHIVRPIIYGFHPDWKPGEEPYTYIFHRDQVNEGINIDSPVYTRDDKEKYSKGNLDGIGSPFSAFVRVAEKVDKKKLRTLLKEWRGYRGTRFFFDGVAQRACVSNPTHVIDELANYGLVDSLFAWQISNGYELSEE